MSDKNIIILPIDFSELSLAALPWARRVSTLTNAPIHCVYVVEPPQVYSALGMAPATALPTPEELADNAGKRLSEFVEEHLTGLDQEPATKVLMGKPSEAIVEYACQVDAAMIIMTTHGYSGLQHIVLGSTTEAVLRKAECPVLSVRSS